jgi:hypothetical protein
MQPTIACFSKKHSTRQVLGMATLRVVGAPGMSHFNLAVQSFLTSNGRYIYPGANTTFMFANGTVLTLSNIAKVKSAFTGVVDGPSFFTHFCNATGAAGSAETAETAEMAITIDSSDAGIVVPGYPTPIETTLDAVVSGYYLNGTGYEDIAVISLLAFESQDFVEFQRVEQKFLADAVRDGKTKLVVDLSANGGGYILQGYDLFRQLFPNIIQDGYTRWRESDTFLTIAQIYSDQSANFTAGSASVENIKQYETTFNKGYDLNFTNQPFLTFADKFAPHVYKGDNYTALMRWNLTDPLTTSDVNFGVGTDITGYNSRTNFTQPFLPENIILVCTFIQKNYLLTFPSFWMDTVLLHAQSSPNSCVPKLASSPLQWGAARSPAQSKVSAGSKEPRLLAGPMSSPMQKTQIKPQLRNKRKCLRDSPISPSAGAPHPVSTCGTTSFLTMSTMACQANLSWSTRNVACTIPSPWLLMSRRCGRRLQMLLSMGRNVLRDRCRRGI